MRLQTPAGCSNAKAKWQLFTVAPKPRSKADRQLAAAFTAAGGTTQELVDESVNAKRLRRARAAATVRDHNAMLASYVDFARHMKDLSIFPGNRTRPEDVIAPGAGDLDHRVLHPFLLYRIKGSIGQIAEKCTLRTAKHMVNSLHVLTKSRLAVQFPKRPSLARKPTLTVSVRSWALKMFTGKSVLLTTSA